MIHNNFQTLFIFFIFKTQTSSTLTKHHSQVEHFYFSENRFITQWIYPLSSNNTIQNWKRKKRTHKNIRLWEKFIETVSQSTAIASSQLPKNTKENTVKQTKLNTAHSSNLQIFFFYPIFPTTKQNPEKHQTTGQRKKTVSTLTGVLNVASEELRNRDNRTSGWGN